MGKILVTTDFSGHSRKGIRFAFQYAQQTQSRVVLLHVLNLFDPEIAIDSRTATPQLRWEEALQLKTNQLKKYIHVVFPSGIPKVDYEIVCLKLERSLAATIIHYSKTQAIEMVFCSENGASIYKTLLGSLPEALLHHCPVPLCIVPNRYRTRPIQSLCYLTDMAHIDDEMAQITTLQRRLEARVEVLFFAYELELKARFTQLHETAKGYEGDTVRFQYIQLIPQTPFKELLHRLLHPLKPSMVVLFRTPNRSLLSRMLFPSKTSALVLENHLPLLVIPKL
ncbi:universal stress protein [Flavobacterium sp.]|jgi:nucleotide-binding universal stress UspA family protein|uniref:universal stress protein n=1 Tax=Flavobacterium sp. TaxID=239 RepID=UPI0022CD05C5|nr:universal stress protein [Flavobacterium sp.]MCZ8145818.1 universal stress protein [Flavobacterium sp.]MCZ8366404.1 universal stress protein [Flavobacterium sp.]